jgi:hypothetical protein
MSIIVKAISWIIIKRDSGLLLESRGDYWLDFTFEWCLTFWQIWIVNYFPLLFKELKWITLHGLEYLKT